MWTIYRVATRPNGEEYDPLMESHLQYAWLSSEAHFSLMHGCEVHQRGVWPIHKVHGL